MTDILTVAHAPGVSGGGLMEYGRLRRDEIIKRAKEFASYEIDKWEKVLAMPDEQFDVRIVRGVHKRELIERLPHQSPK